MDITGNASADMGRPLPATQKCFPGKNFIQCMLYDMTYTGINPLHLLTLYIFNDSMVSYSNIMFNMVGYCKYNTYCKRCHNAAVNPRMLDLPCQILTPGSLNHLVTLADLLADEVD